jgi:hypothetical protein
MQRLSREALVWRQLRHPNVLLFIGLNSQLFPESTLPALISSWMIHGTLKNYMEISQSRTQCNILRLVRKQTRNGPADPAENDPDVRNS